MQLIGSLFLFLCLGWAHSWCSLTSSLMFTQINEAAGAPGFKAINIRARHMWLLHAEKYVFRLRGCMFYVSRPKVGRSRHHPPPKKIPNISLPVPRKPKHTDTQQNRACHVRSHRNTVAATLTTGSGRPGAGSGVTLWGGITSCS